jgi:GTP cyclohydrolase II
MPDFSQRVRERVGALVNGEAAPRPVRRVASARLPTESGDFDIHVYDRAGTAEAHIALVRGSIGSGHDVLTRVHSPCATGDIFFRSTRCDCGPQLLEALSRIADGGRGVLLYLDQEGRGIGLANKIRAYRLQDEGADTIEANERLGFPANRRDCGAALEMLRDLGVRPVRLMSNSPRKLEGLPAQGLVVNERLPIEIAATASTQHHLRTKKHKLGHLLSSV